MAAEETDLSAGDLHLDPSLGRWVSAGWGEIRYLPVCERKETVRSFRVEILKTACKSLFASYLGLK